jgi:CHAT domain-containing protein
MILWKVRDRQTQELMVDFFSSLAAGEGRIEAIRQTQVALKERHPTSYYRAAFICQGETGRCYYHLTGDPAGKLEKDRRR